MDNNEIDLKEKRKIYMKEYKKKNKEILRKKNKEYNDRPEIKKRAKKYSQDNVGKIKNYIKVYRIENKKEIRATDNKFYRKQRKDLSDGYMKCLLIRTLKIDRQLITPELINLKREQMKLKRLNINYQRRYKNEIR